jgi:hypothetical protein
MFHNSYPHHKGTRLGYDAAGRVLPELPTKPFLKAEYQYQTDMLLKLYSLDDGDDVSAIHRLIVKVCKPTSVGHGNLQQIMECEITEGQDVLLGRPVVALVFDRLYTSILDLAVVPDSKLRCLQSLNQNPKFQVKFRLKPRQPLSSVARLWLMMMIQRNKSSFLQLVHGHQNYFKRWDLLKRYENHFTLVLTNLQVIAHEVLPTKSKIVYGVIVPK